MLTLWSRKEVVSSFAQIYFNAVRLSQWMSSWSSDSKHASICQLVCVYKMKSAAIMYILYIDMLLIAFQTFHILQDFTELITLPSPVSIPVSILWIRLRRNSCPSSWGSLSTLTLNLEDSVTVAKCSQAHTNVSCLKTQSLLSSLLIASLHSRWLWDFIWTKGNFKIRFLKKKGHSIFICWCMYVVTFERCQEFEMLCSKDGSWILWPPCRFLKFWCASQKKIFKVTIICHVLLKVAFSRASYILNFLQCVGLLQLFQ